MRPGRHARTIVAVAVVVAASFVVATGGALWTSLGIYDDARQITTNAVPSLRHLIAARAELSALRLASEPAILGRAVDAAEIEASLARMRADLDRYLAVPPYPLEEPLHAPLRASLDRLDRQVARTAALLEAGQAEAIVPAARALDDAAEALQAVVRAVERANADELGQFADTIQHTWRRMVRLTIAFNALSLALAALLVAMVARAAVRRDRVERELARALEQRAVELDAFAGRVAHDIRSPLTAVVLSLERLKRSSPDVAERALASAGRISVIVDALYELARAGRPPSGGQCDVGVVIDGVAAELAEEAKAAPMELVVDVARPCSAGVERGVLESIVSNLMRNALRHGAAVEGDGRAPAGHVWVRARAAGARVRLEVEDDGPGIPVERRGDIFDPYVRASDGPGLGLGLATVKRLVEAHGGSIAVTAGHAGGALFSVELPASVAHS